MEAELELAQAKLAEFKAEAKSSAADTQIKRVKQVDDLEEKVGDTKAKLHERPAPASSVCASFRQ